MKFLSFFFFLFLINNFSEAQNVGIGTSSPKSSAVLDITSTSKGLLPPRMTVAQRNSIVNPVEGLTIWCIDCEELQVYNGFNWVNMIRGAACTFNIPRVLICNQQWMIKNLGVTTYRNGDPIPHVTDPAAWFNLTSGAWCYFNNDSTLGSIYGKLYNWYAVNDPRGLAPQGWHVPSDAEWSTLSTCLGGDAIAGGKMKETGTIHWNIPNTSADNSSGFTALPGGARDPNGVYVNLGDIGFLWSSTEFNTNTSWVRYPFYGASFLQKQSSNKSYGFLVRCLRD